MKIIKVIFLDIDGVVNSEETLKRTKGGILGIDPYLVSIFNRIIFATDAKIVLSSSWRHSKEGRDEVRQQIMDFIDVTPRMPLLGGSETMERGKEIKAWLDKHPEVEKYAILDDDSDFLPDQPLFKTTWKKGLTEEIAKEVIKHLKN